MGSSNGSVSVLVVTQVMVVVICNSGTVVLHVAWHLRTRTCLNQYQTIKQ